MVDIGVPDEEDLASTDKYFVVEKVKAELAAAGRDINTLSDAELEKEAQTVAQRMGTKIRAKDFGPSFSVQRDQQQGITFKRERDRSLAEQLRGRRIAEPPKAAFEGIDVALAEAIAKISQQRIEDPSVVAENELPVGPVREQAEVEDVSFGQAFAKARREGKETFTFNDKLFTTELKEETRKPLIKPPEDREAAAAIAGTDADVARIKRFAEQMQDLSAKQGEKLAPTTKVTEEGKPVSETEEGDRVSETPLQDFIVNTSQDIGNVLRKEVTIPLPEGVKEVAQIAKNTAIEYSNLVSPLIYRLLDTAGISKKTLNNLKQDLTPENLTALVEQEARAAGPEVSKKIINTIEKVGKFSKPAVNNLKNVGLDTLQQVRDIIENVEPDVFKGTKAYANLVKGNMEEFLKELLTIEDPLKDFTSGQEMMKELGRREQEQKDITLARASAATTGKAAEKRKLEDKERTQQQVIQDVLKTDKRKPSAKQAREKEQAASRKRLEKIRQTEKEKKNIRLAKASAAIT